MDHLINLSSGVLSSTLNTASWTLKPVLRAIETGANSFKTSTSQKVALKHILPTTMRPWLGLAGLMGASAVAIGAYGAHVVYPREDIKDNRKAIFETANKYHFLHSLALISVPFARKSKLTGCLFLTGTLVFSGTCYYYAITENKSVSKFTPYGGMALVLAWLSLAL